MKKRISGLILILALLLPVPCGALDLSSDEPICYSNFDMISLQEMQETHQEYTTGDMIADSYLYEARQNGITDIDVAIVPLASIRASVKEGPLTAADAFSICYAAEEGPYAEGAPLVCAYLSGKDLKLLTEIDASLGPAQSGVKLSYAGLNYRFNTKRILMDRVTSVGLARSGGMLELIEDDMLYKVCTNRYAADLLDDLNGLIWKTFVITPRDADGQPLEDLSGCLLTDENGSPVMEWMALADYWTSFRTGDSGLPEVPLLYSAPQTRKVKYEEGGFARIENPGTVTLAVIGAVIVLLILVAVVIALIRRTVYRRRARRLQKGNS